MDTSHPEWPPTPIVSTSADQLQASVTMFYVTLVARSLITLMGIGIAFSVPPFSVFESPLQEVFGVIVTLYGLYGLSRLFAARKQLNREE